MGNSQPKTNCSEFNDLHCPCPAAECNNPTVHYWKHTVCGTQVSINSEAYLKCRDHGIYCSMVDARWSCERHQGDYKKGDREALIHALTIAASFYQTDKKIWASTLIKSILRMTS